MAGIATSCGEWGQQATTADSSLPRLQGVSLFKVMPFLYPTTERSRWSRPRYFCPMKENFNGLFTLELQHWLCRIQLRVPLLHLLRPASSSFFSQGWSPTKDLIPRCLLTTCFWRTHWQRWPGSLWIWLGKWGRRIFGVLKDIYLYKVLIAVLGASYILNVVNYYF